MNSSEAYAQHLRATAILSESAMRAECLEFAAWHGGTNTAAAIAYAESGRLTWAQVHGLFVKALGKAVAELAF